MSRPFAAMFPGQGAQEVGMGRDLFAEDAFTKDLAARASAAAGTDLETLCRKGPDRRLAETMYLQPALTCVCLGLWRRFSEAGLRPNATAGHSLGELSALVACGAAEPEDIVLLAADRGRFMQEAAAGKNGAMAAVSGVSVETVEDAVRALLPLQKVLVAGAVNAPSQVTISGDRDAVAALLVPGAIPGGRVTPLRVSGAWHSPHMDEATRRFEARFAETSLSDPALPMVLNQDGTAAATATALREHIPRQLNRKVRWDKVMQTLLDMGIRDFVEIGPGKVLRGLVRLNDSNAGISVHNIFDLRSLSRVVCALNAS